MFLITTQLGLEEKTTVFRISLSKKNTPRGKRCPMGKLTSYFSQGKIIWKNDSAIYFLMKLFHNKALCKLIIISFKLSKDYLKWWTKLSRISFRMTDYTVDFKTKGFELLTHIQFLESLHLCTLIVNTFFHISNLDYLIQQNPNLNLRSATLGIRDKD